jgi:hypothetical protein
MATQPAATRFQVGSISTGVFDGQVSVRTASPGALFDLLQGRSLVDRQVVGLVALDDVLRLLFGGVPFVAFENNLRRRFLLDRSSNPPGFRIPLNMVAALEIGCHGSNLPYPRKAPVTGILGRSEDAGLSQFGYNLKELRVVVFINEFPMKILFLHGWQSVPGGVKPTYLARHGHEVINPMLPDENFEEAVKIAQEMFDKHQPQAIVGSSRGGAVAMNVRGEVRLVLLCPAWKKWGTAKAVKPDTVILHSRADDVVPFADSEELVARSGLPVSALVEVGSDHRLADPEPLRVMLEACEGRLKESPNDHR